MSYRIFTDRHDRVVHAAAWLEQAQLDVLSSRSLKCFEDALAGMTDVRRHSFDRAIGELEAGLREASGDMPVTILIDCSGSMRGSGLPALVQTLSLAFGALERAGIPFEVLGYTTSSWKGGQAWKDYVVARRGDGFSDRTANPGRVCELLHVVFKERHERWNPALMALMHHDGFPKENVDGEALAWAADRIRGAGGSAALIHVCDGNPVDLATLNVNPADVLREHLAEMRQTLAGSSSIRFHSLLLSEPCEVPGGGAHVFSGGMEKPEEIAWGLALSLSGALGLSVERPSGLSLLNEISHASAILPTQDEDLFFLSARALLPSLPGLPEGRDHLPADPAPGGWATREVAARIASRLGRGPVPMVDLRELLLDPGRIVPDPDLAGSLPYSDRRSLQLLMELHPQEDDTPGIERV